MNDLYIGKSYLKIGKKEEARKYLEKAANYLPKTDDDKEAIAEAEHLLKYNC